MTGSYIGGGVNFAAMASQFDGKELTSAATVADNLLMAAYFFVLIAFAGMKDNCEKMARLRAIAADRLCSDIPEALIIGGGAPHILSVSLPGWRSEVLMNFLEAESIYVSRSSACKKGGRSHVLEAMHLPAQVIDGAIRISFSRYSTEADVLALCSALKRAHDTLAHR